MNTELKDLIGKKIKQIYINQKYLRFITTDNDIFDYTTKADCCSETFFYDFYGVKNLLAGKAITEIKEIPETTQNHNTLRIYGYSFTTISEEFGEITSVFSFRNESNGFYGGYIIKLDNPKEASKSFLEKNTDTCEIKEDITEIK